MTSLLLISMTQPSKRFATSSTRSRELLTSGDVRPVGISFGSLLRIICQFQFNSIGIAKKHGVIIRRIFRIMYRTGTSDTQFRQFAGCKSEGGPFVDPETKAPGVMPAFRAGVLDLERARKAAFISD